MGDVNGDSAVDGLDIQEFVNCVTGPSACGICACANFVFDGVLDSFDAPCFIEALLDGSTTCDGPEPFYIQDCNFNATADAVDIATGASSDCNANGVPDECDIDVSDPDGNSLYSLDVNLNFTPDECEIDCNLNGEPDAWEIEQDPSKDIDDDGIIDVCEPDCNGNSLPDDYDLAEGAADCNANNVIDSCEDDCNSNGVPDDCDTDPTDPDGDENVSPDCNENGIPDACDLSRPFLFSLDCNGNDVPDECELSPESDCNENGILDICDIAASISDDEDDNGIPDECEESFLFGGDGNMMGGEDEFDADAAWEVFYVWMDEQLNGDPGDWHTLSGPQRFERVINELRILGLPLAAPWPANG